MFRCSTAEFRTTSEPSATAGEASLSPAGRTGTTGSFTMDFRTWPRLYVVDVEGNGATPPDLVELAAVPVVDGRPMLASARSVLVRPAHPITPFASRVHGLTDRHVQNCPSWDEVAPRVRADLDGVWIAAHNASVDYNVLLRHLPGWRPAGVLDTLRLARATYPAAPRYSLDALVEFAGLDLAAIPGHRHRAGYDAHAAALLLLNLASSYATWNTMLASAVPPGMPGAPMPDHHEEQLW
ncbi:3'-5' exonuclease [Kitasatospora sp. NBC_00240]|uniref:3'-5' exonuclease n=1 Tax=Kitasatospora sp. NBC_00240 TaxID=2903567 RepID=UPI0022574E2A|nr:3'-5' exonuclease [Kitasatospora sp. NBC_00240]MCX5215713.1 3'-5' exonuclease [Kitasatospora sp. NBC_00240]